MKHFIPCARLILLLILSSQAWGNTVAIKNAKIYTMAGPVLEKGTIVFRNGRIEAVGTNVNIPKDARVIDGSGKVVMPGMIDANCRVGLEEITQVPASMDSSESTDPVTPHLYVVDGFFPESVLIGVTRRNGITAGVVAPDDVNVFTGMSAMIEFSGKRINEVILKGPVAMNITLGEAPKTTYGPKNKMPMTRMGTAALLRKTLQEAKEYGEKWKRYTEKERDKKEKGKDKKDEKDTGKVPEKDYRLEALQDVLSGKLPLVAAAHRVDDILTAIRIAEEFGIKQNLVINHGTDAYQIADLLAREKIPVLVGPVTTQPERIETLGAQYENAARLNQAGVLIAIQTDEAHNARNLPYEAGLAVAYGLLYEEALKAITINAAKIFRVETEVGALQTGKRANLILASGDPLEPRTEIVSIFIEGEELPDTSFQMEMWEKLKKY